MSDGVGRYHRDPNESRLESLFTDLSKLSVGLKEARATENVKCPAQLLPQTWIESRDAYGFTNQVPLGRRDSQRTP